MVVPQGQAEGGIGFDAAEVPGDTLTDRLQCESACNFDPLDGRIGVQF